MRTFLFFGLLLFCCRGFGNNEVPYNSVSWQPPFSHALSGPDGLPLSGISVGAHKGSVVVAGGQYRGRQGTVFSNQLIVFAMSPSGDPFLIDQNITLPESVAFAGLASDDQTIVYAGGENDSGLLSSVWMLTTGETGKLSGPRRLPNLPEPLKQPAMLLVGQTLYLAGGQGEEGEGSGVISLNLDQPSAGWHLLAPLPVPLTDLHLFYQSDGAESAVFIAGSTNIGHIAIYSQRNDSWRPVSQKHQRTMLRLAAVIPQGSTYALAIGGRGNLPSMGDSLYVFNAITGQLSPLDAIAGASEGQCWLLRSAAGILLLRYKVTGILELHKISFSPVTIFTAWDYGVVIGYLLLTVFIGLRFSGRHTSTATYFKGDGSIPSWAVGISILGAQISAISFMSTPAKVYATNWSYFFMSVVVVLVIPFVNRYFIPFYRRLNITSAYEYLDKRFSYAVRAIASALYILFELGRLAIILILPSLALSVVAGLEVNTCVLVIGSITLVYTFKGGLKAVIWTDVMQVFVLLGGSLLCILYILLKLPAAPHELYANLVENDKLHLLDPVFNISTPNFWVVFIGGWTISFLPYSTDQTTVQRYLATKDERGAKKSALIAAWISVPGALMFMLIGTLIYLFYYYHPAAVNILHNSQDSIFPWYIVSQLPAGVRGLLIAGIFAATMSSLSSSLTSASTAFITDFYRVLSPRHTERRYLRAARLSTLVIGLFSISLALYIINEGVVSLWDQYNIFMGLFTGGIGGVFLIGIFTKKANAAGAIGGLLISGIGLYLIGRYTAIHFLLYATLGVLLSLVSGLLISICVKSRPKDLTGLTIFTQYESADSR